MHLRKTTYVLVTAAATQLAAPAPAQEPHLSIELNAAQSRTDGCTLSFLVTNGHGTSIDAAVFETVLFDAEGQVDRLTLFDFGTLPAGRPRVRQFVIPGSGCDAIGRVLFNGADTCDASGLESDACESGLELSSRTDIEVLG